MSARVTFAFCLMFSVLLASITMAYGASQNCDGEDCENSTETETKPTTDSERKSATESATETKSKIASESTAETESKSATGSSSETESKTESNSKSEKAAPYVLRIIKSGEANPRSSNKTKEGRQDNRRSDVTLTRKVPLPTVKNETRRGVFGSGGTVWLSKDPTSLDRILEVKAPASAILIDEMLDKPIEFDVKTNYSHFIERLEILIWSEEATQLTEPLEILSISESIGEQQYSWDGQIDNTDFKPGMSLQYAIRATDGQGRMDQSVRSILRFVEEDAAPAVTGIVSEISVVDEADGDDGIYTELYRQSIPVQGSKVRLLGQDLASSSRVTINNQAVKVDKGGRFGQEFLLPEGEH